MRRKPAVAGYFYPRNPIRLREQIASMIEKVSRRVGAKAVVVPHAGYQYSGMVAGAVYSRVKVPDRLVIIGPNHTGLGYPVSVMTEGVWETPFGDVPIDSELAQAIVDASQVARADHTAHMAEHSIEVQLPFLKYLREEFSIVPIAVMGGPYSICEDLAQSLVTALSGKDGVLMVSSTDMSHYEPQEVAVKKDTQAINEILRLDGPGLYRVVQERSISMCGFMGTAAIVEAAKAMGSTSGEMVRYMTSGDVVGDYSQVVGYAGVIIP
jgi:AmmeMemoRadiSam system protein B